MTMYSQEKVEFLRDLVKNKRARIDGNKIFIDGKERKVEHKKGCFNFGKSYNALLLAYLYYHPDFDGKSRVVLIDLTKGLRDDNFKLEGWNFTKTKKGHIPANTKLTIEQVIEIRRRFKNRDNVPCNTTSLGIDYNVSRGVISKAIKGGTSDYWKAADAVEPPIEVIKPLKIKKAHPKPKVKQIDKVFAIFMKEARKEIRKKSSFKEKQTIYQDRAYDLDPRAVEEMPEY